MVGLLIYPHLLRENFLQPPMASEEEISSRLLALLKNSLDSIVSKVQIVSEGQIAMHKMQKPRLVLILEALFTDLEIPRMRAEYVLSDLKKLDDTGKGRLPDDFTEQELVRCAATIIAAYLNPGKQFQVHLK